MKNTSVLVGCIDKLGTKTIRTRFFYINKESREIRDVTLELCNAIQDYNQFAKTHNDTPDNYYLVIPYEFKNGLANYSFGCGLSHYLDKCEFENIVARSGKPLSFPLEQCSMTMYTPLDIKSIFKCVGVYDINMTEVLLDYHCV